MAVLEKAMGPLAADLQEDVRTSWVPDVANFVEFHATEAVVAAHSPREEYVQWTVVPGPSGERVRPMLSPLLHARFHRAVREIADQVDTLLAPGVCGYRSGALAGSSYSDEYGRFQDISEGETESSPWVVTADVANFFESMPLARVMKRLRDVFDSSSLSSLSDVFDVFVEQGLNVLPAGYADARMLANVMLTPVDAALSLPFARWVDDYRVFAPNQQAASQELDRLAAAVEEVGLRLSAEKTHVVEARQYRRARGMRLTSVYHPERGDIGADAARLRRVFAEAAGNPLRSRAALRFSLPRLAAVGDDVAFRYCGEMLTKLPWEAPRMISYLSHFPARLEAESGLLDGLVRWATASGQGWVLARMCPLLAGVPLNEARSRDLSIYVQSTMDAPSWGLALRILAQSGRKAVVREEIARRVLDPRAAMVALVLCEKGDSVAARTVAPVMSAALAEVGLPGLTAASIL